MWFINLKYVYIQLEGKDQLVKSALEITAQKCQKLEQAQPEKLKKLETEVILKIFWAAFINFKKVEWETGKKSRGRRIAYKI